MEIKKLKNGIIIKNYKELCSLLNIPIKAGDSKKAQLKEFERYCKYRKDGNSFIIDEVYKIPKEKVDNTGKSEGSRGNNSLYSEDIQFLILNILAEEAGGSVNVSCSRLLGLLNLVNENYINGEKNIKELSEMTNVPVANCLDFYMFSRNNLRVKLESALNGLERKRLIIWEKIFFVDIIEKVNEKINHTHRAATDTEKRKILKAETTTLKEMGYETVPYISSEKMKEFRNKVNDKLEKDGLDIPYYYKSYNITFNIAPIKEEIEKVVMRLNKNVINSIEKEANVRHDRAMRKYEELLDMGGENDGSIKFSKLHYEEDYVQYAGKLTDILIRLDRIKNN